MTSVVVTSVNNTIVVTENKTSTVVTVPQTSVVSAVVQGPQGPPGPQGLPGVLNSIGEIPDVNTTAKVNKSLLYYDAPSGKFRADATITTTTITDGGSF